VLIQDRKRVNKDFNSSELVIELEIADFFNISNLKVNNKN